MISLLWAVVYILLAPVIGGLIAGIDRKVTAHMQGRVGPSIFQPFYDVGKLFEKEGAVVNETQRFYVISYFVFAIFSGALFFAGGNLLLVVFALTLAEVFLVLGAYTANSPYSHIGAERELIQIMAYEPMLLLAAVGMYVATQSFNVSDIAGFPTLLVILLPGVFLGFVYILTIKLRKSPFDISTSHHAHQEIVKGVMTEFSGPNLGFIEVAHWYEVVFLLAFVFLFFAASWILGIIAIIIVYLLELAIDNTNARVKWQLAMKSLMGGRPHPWRGQYRDPVLPREDLIMAYLKKSPWIIHYDASSCNGCDIEILACLTPMYDVERFGIINTGNPKHADIFVVTGTVNEQNKYVIKNIYDQMPDPKVVVAIGICATSGGIFRECYNVAGGIDTTIPWTSTCPAAPPGPSPSSTGL